MVLTIIIYNGNFGISNCCAKQKNSNCNNDIDCFNWLFLLEDIGVRPHKEKINISKEIINKTRGAEAPYVARMRMNHTPLRGEQQATVL